MCTTLWCRQKPLWWGLLYTRVAQPPSAWLPRAPRDKMNSYSTHASWHQLAPSSIHQTTTFLLASRQLAIGLAHQLAPRSIHQTTIFLWDLGSLPLVRLPEISANCKLAELRTKLKCKPHIYLALKLYVLNCTVWNFKITYSIRYIRTVLHFNLIYLYI